MSVKYTAIYEDSWMSGSHRHVQIKFRRVERFYGETVQDMLKREDLNDGQVTHLFHGHPTLEGE